MVTKAKRASNDRWDKENMSHVACKLRKERADQFRTLCKWHGTTPNAVLRAAIDAYIDSNGGDFTTDENKGPKWPD